MKLKNLFTVFTLSGLIASSARAVQVELSLNADDPAEAKRFMQWVQKIQSGESSDRNLVLTAPSLDLTIGVHSPWDDSYREVAKNGDMYVLWGNLDDSWTQDEYNKFYTISKWLVKHDFRNIINPVANESDIREAATNPRTSGILWSSHGNTQGVIFGSDQSPVANDAFSTNASPSFRHMVMSNCYADQSMNYYTIPSHLRVKHWTGETTTSEFFQYLVSSEWDNDLMTDLGITL